MLPQRFKEKGKKIKQLPSTKQKGDWQKQWYRDGLGNILGSITWRIRNMIELSNWSNWIKAVSQFVI